MSRILEKNYSNTQLYRIIRSYEYLDDTTFTGNVYGESDVSILLNLSAKWDLPWINGLGVSFTGSNLLDDAFMFIQAYDGGDSPIPGLSREFSVKVTYSF